MSSVVHFEFSVPNPEEAAVFYGAVFGWSITKLPNPINYWQIRTADTPAQHAIPGGIVQSKTGSPRVSLTIQVASVHEACARVTARGGSLITEPRTIPDYGVHVLCRDPQGNFFALLEPVSAG